MSQRTDDEEVQNVSQPQIGIADFQHFRSARPFQNLRLWAERRKIQPVMVPIEPDAPLPALDRVGLIYVPQLHDAQFLERIPDHIPVVWDYDGAFGGRFKNDEHLVSRRFALRRAFGGKIQYKPGFQVPYFHLPVAKPDKPAKRDVIIIDVHRWLPLSAHFNFLSVMMSLCQEYEKIVRSAGDAVKFYFTAFSNPRNYFEAADVFIKKNGVHPPHIPSLENPLQVILDNYIPPIEDVSKFYELFPRTRLFLTDHGDMADQDVVHAGSAGVPIMTIPRFHLAASQGITFTLSKAAEIISPGFADLVKMAEENRVKPRWGHEKIFKTAEVPEWDNSILERAFLRSWDLLWAWALSGEVDQEVVDAIEMSPRWRLR